MNAFQTSKKLTSLLHKGIITGLMIFGVLLIIYSIFEPAFTSSQMQILELGKKNRNFQIIFLKNYFSDSE